jgi:hypothetical protein
MDGRALEDRLSRRKSLAYNLHFGTVDDLCLRRKPASGEAVGMSIVDELSLMRYKESQRCQSTAV